MSVCYFIQSHKNPEQIARLVRRIKQSSSSSHILINHDFSSSVLDLSSFREFSGIDVIERKQPARRGDSSILNLFLDSIKWLFERDRDFDWLVCLSGQDYPIQPIPQIETFLAQTPYHGFLRYWDVLHQQDWDLDADQKRFFAQYLYLPEWTKWSLRKVSRIGYFTPILFQWRFAMVGMKTPTPFNDQFRCYRGFYWNTLSRECLEYLISYLAENPELLRFYQRTLAPEESIIQTVLINSQRFNLCNDDLRFAEFPRELKGFAKLLTEADYPKLIDSQAHFARKFDLEQDRKVLDLLDRQILAKPTSVGDRNLLI